MADKFPQDAVEDLLVRRHRRCCVCHRFCGFKMEIDHIVPGAEGGADTADNAIPVCFECHAEIHTYNDLHPRGRKFRPSELRRHKEQWLALCTVGTVGAEPPAREAGGVGPIQALVDELEFNSTLTSLPRIGVFGGPFVDDQFRRAIERGAAALLRDDLKRLILDAYAKMHQANALANGFGVCAWGSDAWANLLGARRRDDERDSGEGSHGGRRRYLDARAGARRRRGFRPSVPIAPMPRTATSMRRSMHETLPPCAGSSTSSVHHARVVNVLGVARPRNPCSPTTSVREAQGPRAIAGRQRRATACARAHL